MRFDNRSPDRPGKSRLASRLLQEVERKLIRLIISLTYWKLLPEIYFDRKIKPSNLPILGENDNYIREERSFA